MKKVIQTPLFAGTLLGVGAALVQAYFKVIPPVAYGVCMVCHPKDLVNWMANHFLNTDWRISIASTAWPILTVVGVLLGSFVAAYQNGELKLRSARQPLSHFVYGFLMINLGLILGSCPIRIVLLSAYGDWMAVIAWVFIIIGVLLGTLVLRRNAIRQAERRAPG